MAVRVRSENKCHALSGGSTWPGLASRLGRRLVFFHVIPLPPRQGKVLSTKGAVHGAPMREHSIWLYAGRTLGGNCDHCHFDFVAVACCPKGARGEQPRPVQ